MVIPCGVPASWTYAPSGQPLSYHTMIAFIKGCDQLFKLQPHFWCVNSWHMLAPTHHTARYMLRGPPPKLETMLAHEVFNDDGKYKEWCKLLVFCLQLHYHKHQTYAYLHQASTTTTSQDIYIYYYIILYYIILYYII